MSVLTVAGTSIPDPTVSYHYTPSSAPTPSFPSRPVRSAVSAPPGGFSRPERKSHSVSASPQGAPARTVSNHQHSRTISSTTIPLAPILASTSSPSHPSTGHSRVPSSSHSRQSSTSNAMSMHRQGTGASTANLPRRSTSGRSTSTNSPISYVALMRKQKATVWCDRAQNIDPRIVAAQKAAKQRAALEVQGYNSAGRTSTISSGGVVGKIRHGGVPKAPGYVPANMTGASVPIRLSANEMLGDEEEGLSTGDNSMMHGRSGSGRSSTNSAQYRSGYPRPDAGRFSSTSTPPNEGSSGQSIPEDPETGNSNANDKNHHHNDHDKSAPADSEESFGELKELSGPSSVEQAMAQAKKAEDLRRRGSVDERTMSMGTGVRLFVANPDVED
ncbi:uncharacterized protein Z518_00938 [Rhinocladiella mackenziei CBS 650.93]|uniref:Uncharacterized protein n=1 Tax=Rhinocladiella mackenziei CBS 650.93 TaxID=1442369 RepID=A0A0D2G527_9EURO|nr:uncharacterized protein Z518_00938 [Rhinocladiella mackenziei CBS 650.93]KIX09857.1 hypothetical protein Z518_00938 [Rhinocladiella mackenziei CBS 650.93]